MSGRDELAERIARALAPHMEGERDFLTKFTILLGLVLLFALARGMGWVK